MSERVQVAWLLTRTNLLISSPNKATFSLVFCIILLMIFPTYIRFFLSLKFPRKEFFCVRVKSGNSISCKDFTRIIGRHHIQVNYPVHLCSTAHCTVVAFQNFIKKLIYSECESYSWVLCFWKNIMRTMKNLNYGIH